MSVFEIDTTCHNEAIWGACGSGTRVAFLLFLPAQNVPASVRIAFTIKPVKIPAPEIEARCSSFTTFLRLGGVR